MLTNKIALITGASKGIGKAIAIEFAKNNADVIINYNSNKTSALAVEEEIKKLGRKVLSIKADVSKYEDVSLMIGLIKKEFGKINILVNNAGITRDRTLKNMTKDEWESVINVNLNSIYNVTKQALALIPENGSIINISSIVGLNGNFGQCNYSATKSAVIGFTKSLAKEIGKYNIRVNAIAPGFIETDMTSDIPFIRKRIIISQIPLQRIGKSEEVAKLAVFLASDNSSYISGDVIRVDGGFNF
ncbi:MAG: 3-oxoacyl-[acyl-carrier-protein] reductase [Nanoarchaeota archaeon]